MVKKFLHRNVPFIFFLLLIFIIGIVVVSAKIISRDKQYQRSQAATPVQYVTFPQDHAAHPTAGAEWWYINMLVKVAPYENLPAEEISYVISFSRINQNTGLLTSRYSKSTNHFVEKTNVAGALSAQIDKNSKLKLGYSNDAYTRMYVEEVIPPSNAVAKYRLYGNTKEIGAVNLWLTDQKIATTDLHTPLLWGGVTGYCTGKISVFSPNDTYYYSIPNLVIYGSVTDKNGVVRNVTSGKAWIDHQWFSSQPPSDWKGHYWGNTHTYTNESFGFVTQIYATGPKYNYWVRRTSVGKNECGTSLSVLPLEYGTSGYPKKLKVTLNGSALSIVTTLTALSDNQIFTSPIGPKFVETISTSNGAINAKGFSGFGFFETHLKK